VGIPAVLPGNLALFPSLPTGRQVCRRAGSGETQDRARSLRNGPRQKGLPSLWWAGPRAIIGSQLGASPLLLPRSRWLTPGGTICSF
jgi:hypothetical protein